MDISLLGPFRTAHSGVHMHLTAVKPRKVFALLAVHADEAVSVATLVEEVWGENPPRSVQTTLQTYILQIRHLIASALGEQYTGLPSGAKSVLVTESGGYRLDSHGGVVDVREFEALASAGHRTLEQGDWAAASDYLGRALALWKGRALADVQCGALLEVEATRLEESRMSVLHRRIEADLRLGRHYELVGELSGLAARHQLHEGLHEQLMLALYRAGRRSDALGIYHQLRAALSRTLGLDPSPGIDHLYRALLDSSPQLDVDPLVAAGVAGSPLLARAN
ncbi:BTAD domain-containing putative transcriptional regulator [Streptomyces sp. NPDC048441]|uniref:AfsR/SARP family transcriptional regulator n=1 Tax=Streptomyces sp. NPDC048441 TaxID=3365552 RepID=UPI0037222AE7